MASWDAQHCNGWRINHQIDSNCIYIYACTYIKSHSMSICHFNIRWSSQFSKHLSEQRLIPCRNALRQIRLQEEFSGGFLGSLDICCWLELNGMISVINYRLLNHQNKADFSWHLTRYDMDWGIDWFDKEETMVFTSKYSDFSSRFSHHPVLGIW